MNVLFTCENPCVFEVDTSDLDINVSSVDEAVACLYEHLREQLNPDNWDSNDFNDCVSVEDFVEKFRWYITLIDLIQKKDYTCTLFNEDHDPDVEDMYIVFIPLCRHLQ